MQMRQRLHRTKKESQPIKRMLKAHNRKYKEKKEVTKANREAQEHRNNKITELIFLLII
jgi:hypothetical protein